MAAQNENQSPLSGWKKLVSTGVTFIASILGIIFDVDLERQVILLLPFLYTIIEFILDYKRISTNGKNSP